MTVPEPQGGPDDRAAAAEREALIKLHEEALAFFREQLATPAGARARRELETRGLSAETMATFRLRLRAGRRPRHPAGPVRGQEGAAAAAAPERPGRWSGTAGGWSTASGTG